MFEKLINIAVAEFDLVAAGSILVSSGKSNKTNPTLPDNTFLTGAYDANGNTTCVIPGSTIKGVIRSYCERTTDSDTTKLFGKSELQRSKISFHDAYADPDTLITNFRNSTAIEPHAQSVRRNSLNNIQTVDRGTFKAGFKMVNFTDAEMWFILDALLKVNAGIVRFGGKTGRGFGFMRVENFTMNVSSGYNEDMEPIGNVKYESLDEAVFKYGGGR